LVVLQGHDVVSVRLRDELLHASGIYERFPGLERVATLPEIEGIVAAVGQPGRALVLLRGDLDAEQVGTHLLPDGSWGAHGGHRLQVGTHGDEVPLALAAASTRLLAFGDREAVLGSLDPRTAGVWADPRFSSLLREAQSHGRSWGVLLAPWLETLPDAERSAFPGVGRSRATLEWSVFSARVADDVDLRVRSQAGSAEHAAVLADALRSALAGIARGAAVPEIRRGLENAQVASEGAVVALGLTLSPQALERLQRHADSVRLLRWRLSDWSREQWQRPAAILKALDVSSGDRVADVGSGRGFFTLPLARTVGPGGRVFAVDVDRDTVTALRRRVQDAGLAQVSVVMGAVDDPGLPPGTLDAALIVDAYHEMTAHEAMLGQLRRALRRGGRLVIVEPFSPERRTAARADQVAAHQIAPEQVADEVRRAGFEILQRSDEFASSPCGRQVSLVVARRPHERAGHAWPE